MGKLDNLMDHPADEKNGEYDFIGVRECLLSNGQDGMERDEIFQNS